MTPTTKREPVSHTLFAKHLRELGLKFDKEYRFDSRRRFRADFWIKKDRLGYCQRILVDIQGGTWFHGQRSHAGGTGYENDCNKANLATMQDWRFLRFTTRQIMSGEAKEFLRGHVR